MESFNLKEILQSYQQTRQKENQRPFVYFRGKTILVVNPKGELSTTYLSFFEKIRSIFWKPQEGERILPVLQAMKKKWNALSVEEKKQVVDHQNSLIQRLERIWKEKGQSPALFAVTQAPINESPRQPPVESGPIRSLLSSISSTHNLHLKTEAETKRIKKEVAAAKEELWTKSLQTTEKEEWTPAEISHFQEILFGFDAPFNKDSHPIVTKWCEATPEGLSFFLQALLFKNSQAVLKQIFQAAENEENPQILERLLGAFPSYTGTEDSAEQQKWYGFDWQSHFLSLYNDNSSCILTILKKVSPEAQKAFVRNFFGYMTERYAVLPNGRSDTSDFSLKDRTKIDPILESIRSLPEELQEEVMRAVTLPQANPRVELLLILAEEICPDALLPELSKKIDEQLKQITILEVINQVKASSFEGEAPKLLRAFIRLKHQKGLEAFCEALRENGFESFILALSKDDGNVLKIFLDKNFKAVSWLEKDWFVKKKLLKKFDGGAGVTESFFVDFLLENNKVRKQIFQDAKISDEAAVFLFDLVSQGSKRKEILQQLDELPSRWWDNSNLLTLDESIRKDLLLDSFQKYWPMETGKSCYHSHIQKLFQSLSPKAITELVQQTPAESLKNIFLGRVKSAQNFDSNHSILHDTSLSLEQKQAILRGLVSSSQLPEGFTCLDHSFFSSESYFCDLLPKALPFIQDVPQCIDKMRQVANGGKQIIQDLAKKANRETDVAWLQPCIEKLGEKTSLSASLLWSKQNIPFFRSLEEEKVKTIRYDNLSPTFCVMIGLQRGDVEQVAENIDKIEEKEALDSITRWFFEDVQVPYVVKLLRKSTEFPQLRALFFSFNDAGRVVRGIDHLSQNRVIDVLRALKRVEWQTHREIIRHLPVSSLQEPARKWKIWKALSSYEQLWLWDIFKECFLEKGELKALEGLHNGFDFGALVREIDDPFLIALILNGVLPLFVSKNNLLNTPQDQDYLLYTKLLDALNNRCWKLSLALPFLYGLSGPLFFADVKTLDETQYEDLKEKANTLEQQIINLNLFSSPFASSMTDEERVKATWEKAKGIDKNLFLTPLVQPSLGTVSHHLGEYDKWDLLGYLAYPEGIQTIKKVFEMSITTKVQEEIEQFFTGLLQKDIDKEVKKAIEEVLQDPVPLTHPISGNPFGDYDITFQRENKKLFGGHRALVTDVVPKEKLDASIGIAVIEITPEQEAEVKKIYRRYTRDEVIQDPGKLKAGFSDWEGLRNDDRYKDCTLIAKNDKDQKMEIRAHRFVLAGASEYFRVRFHTPIGEKRVEYPVEGDPDTILVLLDFLYTGKWPNFSELQDEENFKNVLDYYGVDVHQRSEHKI